MRQRKKLVWECKERRETWPLAIAKVAIWGRKGRWVKKLKKKSKSRRKDGCVHSETEGQSPR